MIGRAMALAERAVVALERIASILENIRNDWHGDDFTPGWQLDRIGDVLNDIDNTIRRSGERA